MLKRPRAAAGSGLRQRPTRACLLVLMSAAMASTACDLLIYHAVEADRRAAARREQRIDRAAWKSQQGLPLRNTWHCAPTSTPGAKTIECAFQAIDPGRHCGSIEITCPDGRHVASQVCTAPLAREGSQLLRVEDFSPPLATASADCTRIRFTTFGRGFEPIRRSPPPVPREQVDAEVASRLRSGDGLSELRARCAPYFGPDMRPLANAPDECHALSDRGRHRGGKPYKLSTGTLHRVIEQSVEPQVRSCSDASHWRADVTVELAGSGAVRTVEVHGELAQTPTAQCIRDALGAAEFPAMKAPSMKFPYTFAF